MATSYAQGVGTPLCAGRGGSLLGSRSWLDPTRPFLYPAYIACRRLRERRGKVHADLGPQKRHFLPSFNVTDVKEGPHVWDRRDSLRLRSWLGQRDSQSNLVDGQLDGVVREGRFLDSIRANGKAPLWKSMLGVTIGLALCTTLHAGQAQALGTDQIEFATETTLDSHSDQQRLGIISPDIEHIVRDIPSKEDVSRLTVSPFEGTSASNSLGMKGDSISGFTSPELKDEGVNPVLNVSLETTSSKKLDGETEPAPAERKRRTSNGIAAAAAAVAGVSLVASGGASAAAGGTTSAAAAAALTSAASAGGIAALPVSHAVATAAGLHVAEAVGATVAASNVAASTVAAVGATAGVAAGLTTAAGAVAAAGAGAASATAGAVAASASAAAAGTASAATGFTAIAAAGTTSAVAGASSAVAGATSAVAGATSAVVGATSAAAGTTSAAVAAALPLAAASSAVPSTAVLATSLPAAVASKAAIASSAGALSSTVASAVPAVVAKSGATAAATSAGAALSSAVTSAAASSAAAGGVISSGVTSAAASSAAAAGGAVSSAVTSAAATSAGAGGALSSVVTSAGAICTTPVRSVAHAAASAASAALEGGAAAVTAAESAAAAHSAAVLTQSGLASAIASSAHHFVEGGVAGAVGATVVCPIDVVKTRMQGQETKKGEKPKYANPADCAVQILKEEGPGGFFMGLIPQLLGVAPEKAMKLTVNDLLMSILESYIPGARLWTLEVFAGSGGGLAQVVFTNPMEMVKIRQQMQGPAEEGHEKKSALQIAKELGPAGLYQGSVATLLREIPSSAIFFGCYIVLKDAFPDQPFVAGCLAAAPSAFLCTPMDVVKTRMQMERKEGEVPLGFLDTMRKIIREEGPKALFNGGLTRVLRVSPQFGITLAVYEILNHW